MRNLQPGQQIGEVISTIPAANMSAQIIQAIDLCMAYTKECLGATDAQMGNVRPDNTSALMVLQNASEVPLENTRAGLHEWVEDIGAILLDMMGTYYGLRPVVIDHEVRQFDFSVFKHLWLNVSVDVGATTYYSEIAAVQTLDNLRRDGTLSVIEYLERMPDKLITRKQELIDSLKQRLGAEADTFHATGTHVGRAACTWSLPRCRRRKGGESGGYTIGSELDAAKKIAGLPVSMQARYNDLPKKAQKILTR